MNGKRVSYLVICAVVLGCCSIVAPSARADQALPKGAGVLDAYGGYLSWSEQRPDKSVKLMLSKDGVARELKLPDARARRDDKGFDFGPGSDGRPVAVYSLCSKRSHTCAIRTHDLATDHEQTVARTRRGACYRTYDVTIWKGTVAFLKQRANKVRNKPNVKCGPISDKYGRLEFERDNRDLVFTMKLDRGAREHKIGAAQYVTRPDLGSKYLTWLGESYEGSGEYQDVMAYDRRAGRRCSVDGGVNGFEESGTYRESSVGVARPLGKYIVWQKHAWGPTDVEPADEQPESHELMRQRGCKGRPEHAARFGVVLDSNTFIYTSNELLFSAPMPAFAPVKK